MSNYSKILNTMRMVSTQTLSDMKELNGYGINVAAIQKLLNQQNKKKSVERGEKDRES